MRHGLVAAAAAKPDRRRPSGEGLVGGCDHEFGHNDVGRQFRKHDHAGGDVFGVHHHRPPLRWHWLRSLLEDRRVDLARMD